MKNSGKYAARTTHRKMGKIWLIAAIVALMLFLMGSAIVRLVTLKVDDVKVEILGEGTFEGAEVQFEKLHDDFIELGAYYPQEIPDGYTMTFVSEGAPYQSQTIVYENNAGNQIIYRIYVGDPASNLDILQIISKTEVDINGHAGILYEQKGNNRALVWTAEAQGYGFVLQTGDTAVDLLAMAESTAEGEPLVPSNAESEARALEQLGDFSPSYLPEGYEEQGVSASPPEEGGGYVRKFYVNKAENTSIYFEYESYVIATEDGYEDNAKTACSFRIPGCDILQGEIVGEETEINGMYAIVTEQDIVWADGEKHVVYHLYSEDVTGQALLEVARSIEQ